MSFLHSPSSKPCSRRKNKGRVKERGKKEGRVSSVKGNEKSLWKDTFISSLD